MIDIWKIVPVSKYRHKNGMIPHTQGIVCRVRAVQGERMLVVVTTNFIGYDSSWGLSASNDGQ
jgi:hypothetical protein